MCLCGKRNIFSLHDEFWIFYLNLSVAFLSVLSQALHLYLPGKYPTLFAVCIRNVPTENENLPIFNNFLYNIVQILCFLLHCFLHFKAFLFKRRNPINAQSIVGTIVPTDKYTLSDKQIKYSKIANNVCICFLTIIGALTIPRINRLSVKELNTYPNNMIIVFFQLYYLNFLILVCVGFYLYRHPHLREMVIAELTEQTSQMLTWNK